MKATDLIQIILLISILPAVSAQPVSSRITIQGYIESYAWDEKDETIQISILVNPSDGAHSGQPAAFLDYVVDNTRKGRELYAFIGQYAEVTGTITANQDSIKQIRIEKYTILEDEPALDFKIE